MSKISFKIDEKIIENIHETDDLFTYKISSELGEYLKFGVCMSELLELELNNIDDRYKDIKIYSKEIDILKDDVLQKKYYINDVSRENNKIKIKAYDRMTKLEKVWTELRTPITLKNLLIETLKQVNIETVNNITFTNENYVVWDLSGVKGKTCREVISYILELGGTNSRINEEDKFELVSFKTKEINVNVDNVLKLSTDDNYITVDNVSYFRSDMEYMKTNNSRTNYIKMSSNNPLVKISTTERLQEIINKINVDFTYIPSECEIIQSDLNFKVGDLLKITHNNKEYKFYITKISYKNNNYMTITSESVECREDTESNLDKSMSMGGVNFYETSTKTEIKLQDCSQNTKIYATLNFYSENEKYINLMINNKFNRQFKCSKGNNNIGNIIDYDFKDSVNTLKFSQMDNEDIENYSISLMYQNASICDVYEKDYDVNDTESPLNQTENKSYSLQNIFGLVKLKSNTKLVILREYIGFNNKNKEGIDVVCYCEYGMIYINNEENNFKICIDDLHNNLIEYSEEDIKKLEIFKDWNDKEYYILEIPFSLGIITEYNSSRYIQSGTIGECFRLVNDECVYYPKTILRNIIQRHYVFNEKEQTFVISNRFKVGDRTEEAEDETIEDKLLLTGKTGQNSTYLYQNKNNEIHIQEYGNDGILFDKNFENNLEIYKEFKNTKLFYSKSPDNVWLWMMGTDEDYTHTLEICKKYNTNFYQYIMVQTDLDYVLSQRDWCGYDI